MNSTLLPTHSILPTYLDSCIIIKYMHVFSPRETHTDVRCSAYARALSPSNDALMLLLLLLLLLAAADLDPSVLLILLGMVVLLIHIDEDPSQPLHNDCESLLINPLAVGQTVMVRWQAQIMLMHERLHGDISPSDCYKQCINLTIWTSTCLFASMYSSSCCTGMTLAGWTGLV
jgi:hypothetical protein